MLLFIKEPVRALFSVNSKVFSFLGQERIILRNGTRGTFPPPLIKSPTSSLAINGYIYGNLPGLEMCADTSMSWHLFGMGSEIDIHAAYFYGHTFTSRDQRADVVGLFPATFITAEMTPSSPGRWLITCQVNEHLRGMLL